MRDLALYRGRESFAAWGKLEHAVRTGEPAFDAAHGDAFFSYLRKHPEAGAAFDGAMEQLSQRVIAEAIAHYDFGAAARILDVGGGRGHFAAAVLQAHPDLEGAVFDVPEVADAAREQLRRSGLGERCAGHRGQLLRLAAGRLRPADPEVGPPQLGRRGVREAAPRLPHRAARSRPAARRGAAPARSGPGVRVAPPRDRDGSVHARELRRRARAIPRRVRAAPRAQRLRGSRRGAASVGVEHPRLPAVRRNAPNSSPRARAPGSQMVAALDQRRRRRAWRRRTSSSSWLSSASSGGAQRPTRIGSSGAIARSRFTR